MSLWLHIKPVMQRTALHNRKDLHKRGKMPCTYKPYLATAAKTADKNIDDVSLPSMLRHFWIGTFNLLRLFHWILY